LKTHCGMYECMEFMPKFLRWWVTNLAGWRYSPVKPLLESEIIPWNMSWEFISELLIEAKIHGKLYCGLISELHIEVKAKWRMYWRSIIELHIEGKLYATQIENSSVICTFDERTKDLWRLVLWIHQDLLDMFSRKYECIRFLPV
jgi:hypothetical protein